MMNYDDVNLSTLGKFGAVFFFLLFMLIAFVSCGGDDVEQAEPVEQDVKVTEEVEAVEEEPIVEEVEETEEVEVVEEEVATEDVDVVTAKVDAIENAFFAYGYVYDVVLMDVGEEVEEQMDNPVVVKKYDVMFKLVTDEDVLFDDVKYIELGTASFVIQDGEVVGAGMEMFDGFANTLESQMAVEGFVSAITMESNLVPMVNGNSVVFQ